MFIAILYITMHCSISLRLMIVCSCVSSHYVESRHVLDKSNKKMPNQHDIAHGGNRFFSFYIYCHKPHKKMSIPHEPLFVLCKITRTGKFFITFSTDIRLKSKMNLHHISSLRMISFNMYPQVCYPS